jgi:hypothetical protein
MDRPAKMTIGQMSGGFSVNDRGRLLWNGEEVVTKQRITLRWFELLLATIATIATVASALWPIIDHFWV